VREIAAFVSSDEGKTYGRVCKDWGVDPGAVFDDDVLAYNLRLGLSVSLHMDDVPDDEADRLELVAAYDRIGAELSTRA